MTLVEAPEATVERDVALGHELADARNLLGKNLANTYVSEGEFAFGVCQFINAFQAYVAPHIQPARDEDRKFASHEDIANALSTQMYAMTGERGFSFDVTDRVRQYQTDEYAEALRRQRISATSRTITLTLFDMIYERLPGATTRNWDYYREVSS